MDAKPNLFIVGAPKCGTTAWVEYLSSHPDVFFPEIKEPHYFNFGGHPDRRMSFEEYQRLYRNARGKAVIGDASVAYLASTVAAKEIKSFNPDAKILIFLRDQEHCVPSWHNQLLYNGTETISDFEEAWRLSGHRNASNTSKYCLSPVTVDYKKAGYFAEKIERYVSAFGSDQVRIFHFRDWVANPRATYLGILNFLGLADDGRTAFPPVNEARQQRTRVFIHLVRNPPKIVEFSIKAAKRVLGRQSTGLGKFALSIGSRTGYRSELSDELRAEIRTLYREDNERVEPLIWRPKQ